MYGFEDNVALFGMTVTMVVLAWLCGVASLTLAEYIWEASYGKDENVRK